MGRILNPNFRAIVKAYNEGASGIALEGSSRSGKTFSTIDFLIKLTARDIKNEKIVITRDTYSSFKTTLYDDFNRRLPMFGIPSPFQSVDNVSKFDLSGTKIHLIGSEDHDKLEGAGNYLFWMNEVLDQRNEAFDQLEQRCRKFFICDYNPKTSDHWFYDKVCNRPDVAYFRSTFEDNPYISPNEKKKILSYDPSNPVNVTNGTADDYRWKVYGLGVRCAQSGLVFKDVTWIDALPTDVDQYFYGLDFGFTNHPSCLTKSCIKGNNLYVQYLVYEPTENADVCGERISHFVEKKKDIIWCDSASPGMITSLDDLGYLAYGVRKFPGSILFRIDLVKRYKLHIVRSAPAEKEINNYAFRTINGIQLNEPIDDFNHGIDSFSYALQMSR